MALASIMSVVLSVSARAQDETVTALVNVNVIPMDTERVQVGYTVVVDAGEIVVVAPSDDVRVPAGAEVIEGGGAYLMPGLAEST